MSEFEAVYFDGRSSTRRAVRVHAGAARMRVVGMDVDFEVPTESVRLEPPISGRTHLLHLPDGAQLRTDDVDAVESIFPPPRDTWVRRLEARWSYALVSVALIGIAAAWGVVYGLPMAAEAIAWRLPEGVSRELGTQSLAALDGTFCSASKLPAPRQQEVRARALDPMLIGEDADGYRLEFRSCRALGANAFALPGGTIVVTDQLVKIAADEQEIAAVLAHEIGHVRYRHGLRLTLQGAGVAILVTTLAGDAVSITSLAAALPTVLLNSGYSRDFEDEADGFALKRLRQAGVSPNKLADMLERLEMDHYDDESARERASAKKRGRNSDYLSTHPATTQRIARARAAAAS